MRSRADSVPCMDDAGSATVTMQLTLTPEPSAAVPVITAVPGATRAMVPLLSTVATLLSELLQCMVLSVAFSGSTVAASSTVSSA